MIFKTCFWLILFLSTFISPALAQDSRRITPENAADIQLLDVPDRGRIQNLKWSPDGKILLVQTSLGAWFYDLDTLAEAPQLLQGGVIHAFSPDSRYIAGSSQDHWGVNIWPLATNKPATEPSLVLEDAETPVIFTSDSRYIITGDSSVYRQTFDNLGAERDAQAIAYLQIWDVETGARLARLGDHDFRISRFALNQDGKQLVSIDWGSTHLWDIANLEAPVELARFGIEARAIAFDKNSVLVLAAEVENLVGDGASLQVWRYDDANVNFARQSYLEGDIQFTSYLALSAANDILASDIGGIVRLWDITNSQEIMTFEEDAARLIRTENGMLVGLMVNEGNFTRLLSPYGDELARYNQHGDMTLAAAQLDGEMIATSNGVDVWLWNMADAAFEQRLNFASDKQPNTESTEVDYSTATSPDQRWRVEIREAEVVLIDAGSSEVRQTLPIPEGSITESFMEYQEQQGNTITNYTIPPSVATGVAFSPNSEIIIAGGYQYIDFTQHGFAQVWRIDDGTAVLAGEYALGQFKNRVDGFVFNPTSSVVAFSVYWDDSCLRGSGVGRLIDLEANELVPIPGARWTYAFDFSPDGALLAAGGLNDSCTGRGGQLNLFDVEKRAVLHQLGFAEDIGSVVFDTAGEQLRVALGDGTFMIWGVK